MSLCAATQRKPTFTQFGVIFPGSGSTLGLLPRLKFCSTAIVKLGNYLSFRVMDALWLTMPVTLANVWISKCAYSFFFLWAPWYEVKFKMGPIYLAKMAALSTNQSSPLPYVHCATHIESGGTWVTRLWAPSWLLWDPLWVHAPTSLKDYWREKLEERDAVTWSSWRKTLPPTTLYLYKNKYIKIFLSKSLFSFFFSSQLCTVNMGGIILLIYNGIHSVICSYNFGQRFKLIEVS